MASGGLTRSGDALVQQSFAMQTRVIKAMASVMHDNVVRIYSFGETDDGPYIVMEQVSGGDLSSALGKKGTLPPTAVANMTAVTKKCGPSPLAFLIVPLVGAFFIDISNALIIQFLLDRL